MFSTTKRLLIQEFIDSSDETLKSNSLDDLHIETLQEFLQNPENDLEVCLFVSNARQSFANLFIF